MWNQLILESEGCQHLIKVWTPLLFVDGLHDVDGEQREAILAGCKGPVVPNEEKSSFRMVVLMVTKCGCISIVQVPSHQRKKRTDRGRAGRSSIVASADPSQAAANWPSFSNGCCIC